MSALYLPSCPVHQRQCIVFKPLYMLREILVILLQIYALLVYFYRPNNAARCTKIDNYQVCSVFTNILLWILSSCRAIFYFQLQLDPFLFTLGISVSFLMYIIIALRHFYYNRVIVPLCAKIILLPLYPWGFLIQFCITTFLLQFLL